MNVCVWTVGCNMVYPTPGYIANWHRSHVDLVDPNRHAIYVAKCTANEYKSDLLDSMAITPEQWRLFSTVHWRCTSDDMLRINPNFPGPRLHFPKTKKFEELFCSTL